LRAAGALATSGSGEVSGVIEVGGAGFCATGSAAFSSWSRECIKYVEAGIDELE
jgi:hypothetical protein